MAKRDIDNPAQQGGQDRDEFDETTGGGAEDVRGIADEEDAEFDDSDDLEDDEEEETDEAM